MTYTEEELQMLSHEERVAIEDALRDESGDVERLKAIAGVDEPGDEEAGEEEEKEEAEGEEEKEEEAEEGEEEAEEAEEVVDDETKIVDITLGDLKQVIQIGRAHV